MLNQCVLVGRIHDIRKDTDETKITLEVSRNIMNQETNSVETDFLEVKLQTELSSQSIEYLDIGCVVGVKARLKPVEITIGENRIKTHAIIAEKITFIKSNNA